MKPTEEQINEWFNTFWTSYPADLCNGSQKCTKCKKVKQLSDFNKDKSKKRGYKLRCKACRKQDSAKYRAENIEKVKKSNALWQKNNPEKCAINNAKYCSRYPEREKARLKRYRDSFPEKRKQAQRKWRLENKGKAQSLCANYRAEKLLRTPKWLTVDDCWLIDEIYKLSALRTKITGVRYEVDHDIPLRGTFVSGLHVPENLRVITKVENISKGNRYHV